jgi:REP element-mobilizing transposase RayT
MVRGINKSFIFKDEQDKSWFLDRLGRNVVEGKCVVYAWVLMDNHLHLLFKSGKDGISSVMRKLLTWYAQYFNRRHKRSGHLFENRYKSILCDEDNYLLSLVRYIHLNPVRASIVGSIYELDSYPWSGHVAIIGKVRYPWMDTEHVLRTFGSNKRKAVAEYRRFIQEELASGQSTELTGGGLVQNRGGWSQVVAMRRRGQKDGHDERILGGGDFVNKILKESEDRHLRQTKLKRGGRTIQEIIDTECKERGISLQELKAGSKRRRVSETRARIAYRSREELGLSAAEIARHLGVNTSCIVRLIKRLANAQDYK